MGTTSWMGATSRMGTAQTWYANAVRARILKTLTSVRFTSLVKKTHSFCNFSTLSGQSSHGLNAWKNELN
jgi:hypothetical protein